MHLPQVIQRRTGKFPGLRKTRSRRAVFLGTLMACMLALSGTAAGVLPAHAAATTDSFAAATPYQNKVLDSAMTRVAGGTRVSASEVEWDNGRVILGASAPDVSTMLTKAATSSNGNCTPSPYYGCNPGIANKGLSCPDGFFCAYGTPNFGGNCWMDISAEWSGYELDWAKYSGAYCLSVGTWSWWNRTDQRVWKEAVFTDEIWDYPYVAGGGEDSGNTWCISPGVQNTDVTDNVSRQLGWIWMSSNTSPCPAGT
jgi:hypothetical protein